LSCAAVANDATRADNPVLQGLRASIETVPDHCLHDWLNIKIDAVNYDVSVIPDAAWATAFIGFDVLVRNANGGPWPIFYMDLTLIGLNTGSNFKLDWPWYVALPPETIWQTIEIPIGLIQQDSGMPATANGLGGSLTAVQFGAEFGIARLVQLDNIRLRF
jgi:hypothetical protein